MESKSGTVAQTLDDAQRFFKQIRFIHITCSIFMFATGVSATILSNGSDGSSKVPYFFSAYIAGTIHLLLLCVCQVCIFFLSGDSKRMMKASTWVTVYIVICSLFVLFNVMGFVFVIVNGFCIHNQQCYYTKNHTANRFLAVSLVLQHVVTSLFCVLFVKRVHAIDSDLGSDISIKLGHYFDLVRQRIRERNRPQSSSSYHASSISTLGSCSSLHKNNAQQLGGNNENSDIDREKIIAAFMAKRANEEKNRSKSHPNLHRHVHDTHHDHQEIEGTVFSIYSDSETTPSMDGKRKKRYKRHRQNSVQPVQNSPENTQENNLEKSPENIPENASDSEKQHIGTGRSEDSGVSVDDDMWSSSSTSTFRQRPEGLPRSVAQNSDIASDTTETDSVLGRYKTHLEQQQREDIRQQMLDKHKAKLDKHNFLNTPNETPPPPYEEPQNLPNATVLSIQTVQQEESVNTTDSIPENQNQSNC